MIVGLTRHSVKAEDEEGVACQRVVKKTLRTLLGVDDRWINRWYVVGSDET